MATRKLTRPALAANKPDKPRVTAGTRGPREPAAAAREARPPVAEARRVRASSINRALTVLGDHWTVLILRDAFLGVRLFEEFQRRLEIPRQTLINRLRELTEHFVLYKKPYQERPLRHEYRLTRKGLDLYPFVLMVWRWQRRWSTELEPLPPALVHKNCGKTMQPVFACDHCRAEVRLEDVQYADGPGAGFDSAPRPRARRWTLTTAASAAERTRVALHASYITSDRWTHLVLSSIFTGHASFEAIQADIQLASNILAHRLKLLIETGLLEKSAAASDARRFVYRLTDKSRDIFPMTLALSHWADKWLAGNAGPPRLRVHTPCGAALLPVVTCSACHGILNPWEVGFRGAGQAGQTG